MSTLKIKKNSKMDGEPDAKKRKTEGAIDSENEMDDDFDDVDESSRHSLPDKVSGRRRCSHDGERNVDDDEDDDDDDRVHDDNNVQRYEQIVSPSFRPGQRNSSSAVKGKSLKTLKVKIQAGPFSVDPKNHLIEIRFNKTFFMVASLFKHFLDLLYRGTALYRREVFFETANGRINLVGVKKLRDEPNMSVRNIFCKNENVQEVICELEAKALNMKSAGIESVHDYLSALVDAYFAVNGRRRYDIAKEGDGDCVHLEFLPVKFLCGKSDRGFFRCDQRRRSFSCARAIETLAPILGDLLINEMSCKGLKRISNGNAISIAVCSSMMYDLAIERPPRVPDSNQYFKYVCKDGAIIFVQRLASFLSVKSQRVKIPKFKLPPRREKAVLCSQSFLPPHEDEKIVANKSQKRIVDFVKAHGRKRVIGVNAVAGSGKTSLVSFLKDAGFRVVYFGHTNDSVANAPPCALSFTTDYFFMRALGKNLDDWSEIKDEVIPRSKVVFENVRLDHIEVLGDLRNLSKEAASSSSTTLENEAEKSDLSMVVDVPFVSSTKDDGDDVESSSSSSSANDIVNDVVFFIDEYTFQFPAIISVLKSILERSIFKDCAILLVGDFNQCQRIDNRHDLDPLRILDECDHLLPLNEHIRSAGDVRLTQLLEKIGMKSVLSGRTIKCFFNLFSFRMRSTVLSEKSS